LREDYDGAGGVTILGVKATVQLNTYNRLKMLKPAKCMVALVISFESTILHADNVEFKSLTLRVTKSKFIGRAVQLAINFSYKNHSLLFPSIRIV